jgi:hypothetical protein
VGLENELIGQSNFPHQPAARGRTWPIFFLTGGCSNDAQEIHPWESVLEVQSVQSGLRSPVFDVQF